MIYHKEADARKCCQQTKTSSLVVTMSVMTGLHSEAGCHRILVSHHDFIATPTNVICQNTSDDDDAFKNV